MQTSHHADVTARSLSICMVSVACYCFTTAGYLTARPKVLRTTSLWWQYTKTWLWWVSHASKILLRIILERIRVKTETEIADKQAEFRLGSGTRDQVMNLKILMHNAREHRQPLCMCFVDFKKAFDSISHDKL